jgi:hypothetical protein
LEPVKLQPNGLNINASLEKFLPLELGEMTKERDHLGNHIKTTQLSMVEGKPTNGVEMMNVMKLTREVNTSQKNKLTSEVNMTQKNNLTSEVDMKQRNKLTSEVNMVQEIKSIGKVNMLLRIQAQLVRFH